MPLHGFEPPFQRWLYMEEAKGLAVYVAQDFHLHRLKEMLRAVEQISHAHTYT